MIDLLLVIRVNLAKQNPNKKIEIIYIFYRNINIKLLNFISCENTQTSVFSCFDSFVPNMHNPDRVVTVSQRVETSVRVCRDILTYVIKNAAVVPRQIYSF